MWQVFSVTYSYTWFTQVLIHHAIPSGRCLIGNGFIFQHDNNPKHIANAVKSYLEREGQLIKHSHGLASSPDLNIIEAVWAHLDREINKRLIKTKEELQEVLKEA